MPRQVLFIQGAGEAVHDTWDDKLVLSLERELGDGYTLRYPRMPHEADPHYEPWKSVLIHELGRLDDGAILVGHSLGGTMLLHVLAERHLDFRPGALVLVAPPYIGEGGWPSDEMDARTDFAAALPSGLPVLLYHGTEDEDVPFTHSKLYATVMPQAVVHPLSRRDHQLNNDLREIAEDIRALP